MTVAAQLETKSSPSWKAWTELSLDRFRAPYWVVAVALGLVVLSEQIMERLLVSSVDELFQPRVLAVRSALPVLTIYMLLALKTLKTSALPQLAQIRPSVKITDAEFDGFVRRMLYTSWQAEVTLLASSLLVVLTWFVVIRQSFPLMPGVFLPANAARAALAVIAYTIFGWAGLSLVYSSLRFGRGLAALADQPLIVNVFDPGGLLGFGRLSLRHSLTVAVTILLFIIPLGRPTEVYEYAVIFLASMASLTALVLPLWGVHRDMAKAREDAAARISRELADCQARLMNSPELDLPTLTTLSERTEKLVGLRSLIYKTPTWPFRDVFAVFRVLLAAMSPLLIFALQEVIRTYVLPFFGIS
ncbi:MAG: hypothetical protein ACK2U9_02785 [Anaerolineae bacterium]